ncbi:hypothetical protein AVEN_82826-1 [Araneus ventricosus]|uniref:Uncharacterized protein n=1 Tax=Araneus ventricosus TaxID=182803 RepID=A0A4Y2F9B9_ARAVE|nr:hypothetical protein AVEN_82826-1 [Araneus ventricosus]
MEICHCYLDTEAWQRPSKSSQLLADCTCKLRKKIVNARLTYILEKNGSITGFQSGFRKGCCTMDNLILLESAIRTTFLRRHHLVSIFFDIEKAYDRDGDVES